MACTDIDIYEDVKHCVGSTNLPGTREYCYMTRRANIVKWPAKAPMSVEGSTLESIVRCTGNFTLASDAIWVKISLTPDANSFTCESQGNWGSKTFNNTATLVHPGVKEEAAGLCAMLNNDDVVFLVPQRDGKFRVFGNEMFQLTATPKQESGAAAAGDSAQTTIEIAVTDDTPAPFYEGEIETSEGTVNKTV